jgi:hypothetical protein
MVAGARRINVFALHLFLQRVSDAVNGKIERAKLFPHLDEDFVDIFIPGHIARQHERILEAGR